MLLYKLTENENNLDIETQGHLSEDMSSIIISQNMFRGRDVVATNEIYLPIQNFAVLSKAITKQYVESFLDKYNLE